MLSKELIKYQDRLFYVYRRVRQGLINEDRIQEVKEFWFCDIVLKQKTSSNDEVYLFLREIVDAVIV